MTSDRQLRYPRVQNFTVDGLLDAGFSGFVRFADLPATDVPRAAGVYVVVRESVREPVFLGTSPAGQVGSRVTSVSPERLSASWIPACQVLHIGKASAGSSGGGLRKRLSQYRRFGEGTSASHHGGRFVWQLADAADLVVAWSLTPDQDPEEVESALLADFIDAFGRLPFANLKEGKKSG